jgi:VanZ family protein
LKSLILRYLPVLLWMVLIFNLSASSNPYKAVLPSHWQSTCTQWLSSSPMAHALCQDDTVGDTSHVLEYAILAFLCLRALVTSERPLAQNKSLILLALLITLLYALSDETHQLFVKGRAFQLADLARDATGAGLGLACAWFILKNPKSLLVVHS